MRESMMWPWGSTSSTCSGAWSVVAGMRGSSEDRGQRTVGLSVGAVQERARVVEHRAEHPSDFHAGGGQPGVVLGGDEAAIVGKVQRGVGFVDLPVAVGQLVHEARFVPPPGPRFP